MQKVKKNHNWTLYLLYVSITQMLAQGLRKQRDSK